MIICMNFFNLPVSKSASFIASLLLDIEYAVEKANSTWNTKSIDEEEEDETRSS